MIDTGWGLDKTCYELLDLNATIVANKTHGFKS